MSTMHYGVNPRGPRWDHALANRAEDDALVDTAPPHIVLAEDDDDARRLIREWLWEEGCLVTEVATGTELARVVGAYLVGGSAGLGIDAVVSDVRMPGASGMEILRRLRERDPALPVVLITAFGSREVHREAARLGATILDKPFDRARLLWHLDPCFP